MNNPELRRYAWLELGLHRLLAVPLVLAALVVMVVAISDAPAEPLAQGALVVFAVFTIGWGTMRAYASVIDEVRDRTWDFQRMAALEPGALALGKVFGAPILGWYIGAWCLLVYLVAGTAARLPHMAVTLLAAVAVAVMLHSLGVAVSALATRTALAGRGRRFGGILLLLALLWLLPILLGVGWTAGREHTVVHWWLLRRIELRTFAAASAVLFAAWAAFAAWRAMARELREPAWWWGWPAFAAFTAFWWAGIRTPATDSPVLGHVLALAAGILVAAAYLGLSLDPLNPVSWARLSRLAVSGQAAWHRRVPLWLVHALLALALAALAVLYSLGSRSGNASFVPEWLRFGLLPPTALALALMVLRDAALVSCFTLTTAVRRPLATATFYILVADLLLPALLAALQQPALARAVFPLLGAAEHVLYPAAGMAIHLAVALGVLWLRMRRKP